MEETIIVIMEKNIETGFLEEELASLKIKENEEYLLNIFAIKDESQNLKLHLKITTKNDVSDFLYEEIYNYYDLEIYTGLDVEIFEDLEIYNPTWEIILDFVDDNNILINKIENILTLHKNELGRIFLEIQNKSQEK